MRSALSNPLQKKRKNPVALGLREKVEWLEGQLEQAGLAQRSVDQLHKKRMPRGGKGQCELLPTAGTGILL